MQFIQIEEALINLDQITTIMVDDCKLRLGYANSSAGEFYYKTKDDAKIAFSEIKMQIDRLQGGVK